VTAFLAQQPYFRTRLKSMILALLCGALACAAAFSICLPSVVDASNILPDSIVALGIAITLLGWCIGAAYPLAFELAVEMLYPMSEAVTAGLLTIFMNGTGAALLFVAPSLSGSTMNAILVCVLLIPAALVGFIGEKYARQLHEKHIEELAEGAHAKAQGKEYSFDASSMPTVAVAQSLQQSPSSLSTTSPGPSPRLHVLPTPSAQDSPNSPQSASEAEYADDDARAWASPIVLARTGLMVHSGHQMAAGGIYLNKSASGVNGTAQPMTSEQLLLHHSRSLHHDTRGQRQEVL
jgi:hypothetical protein